ncbi:MAB_1171c family putative transporter [Nocardia sp. NPDC050710]|uniref:MAB_1171c family putative transporter n=1 Tax=Nocardia sp. NPDC050710 TaxID=3157220 RepID=UPI0033D78F14
MMAPVPGWAVVAVLTFVIAIVVGRWLLVHDSLADRLVDRALSWMVLAVLIEEIGARTAFAELTYRLFLASGVFAVVDVLILAALFAGADPETVRGWQFRCVIAAAFGAAVVFVIGRPSDPAVPGYEWKMLIVWAVFNVPSAVSGTLTVRACVRELRIGGGTVRQRLVILALLISAGTWVYAAVFDGARVLAGYPSISPAAYWSVGSCLGFVGIVALTAVPMLKVFIARRGWDSESRKIRRLRPLWRDLTAVVPGVVLTDHVENGREPASQLYRMLVEIRDALVHLRAYVPRQEFGGWPSALLIARAAQSKSNGGLPPVVGSADRPEPISGDLETELEQLLELAKEWQEAWAFDRPPVIAPGAGEAW